MNIGATTPCSLNPITGSLYNVTRGYDSASLFTDPCGYGYGNWKTINYTNLQYPAAASAITTGCAVPPMGLPDGELGVFWGPLPWGTGNPAATPLFSVPDDVTLANPSWQTCSAISYGIWDPPIKLTKETAMVPAAPTLSQQLVATARSPISTPYGPATVIPSVEDPKTDAPQLLPPIPPGNSDPNSPTGDSSFSSSNPTDNARPSGDPSNGDPASNAPSATLPSIQIHRPAQRITGSVSGLLATPAINTQSPAPGSSPGPRLSVQPDIEDSRFALSLVAPIVMPQSNTVEGQTMAANSEFISLPANTFISGQSGIDIAGTPVELDISSQLVIGAPQIGRTTVPLSAVSSGIFTVGGQVFTAKSNAIFIEGERIAPGGQGKTIGGTQVSLGSSGLLDVGSSTIFLSTERTTIPLSAVSSGIFTVGGQVFTAKSNAIFLEGERIAPGGRGKTIGGVQVSLGSSGLLHVGSSTIFLSAEQALPTIFTVGSEVFTPNPTAISMDGTTITAGGPGVTIAGTQVSLGSSGLLDVGSSTISLSVEQALPIIFTVGSEVFTPNPTAISMDGTMITAGGPGVTIAGTPVDLQASGSLIIGNSTFAVIPTTLCTSPTNLILEGQATRRGRNMFFRGEYILTLWIVVAAL